MTKTTQFEVKTRAKTIDRYICTQDDLFDVAKELFIQYNDPPKSYRLLGALDTHTLFIDLTTLGIRMTSIYKPQENPAPSTESPLMKYDSMTSLVRNTWAG